ncbi:MAG: diguanylate phosphodiesterase, partial [Variovorax sp.]
MDEVATLSVLLGRQPIVDRAGALVAYELLFRGSMAANAAVIADDHAATEQVILNAIAQFGVAVALGAHRGFVNIGRASLGSDSLLLLEPERFTLEILEDVVIDDEVEAACVRLRQAGFQIAL